MGAGTRSTRKWVLCSALDIGSFLSSLPLDSQPTPLLLGEGGSNSQVSLLQTPLGTGPGSTSGQDSWQVWP